MTEYQSSEKDKTTHTKFMLIILFYPGILYVYKRQCSGVSSKPRCKTTRRDWLWKTADDLSVANGRDANVTKIKVWSGYRATSQHRAGTTA